MSFKDKKLAFVFPGQGSQYIGMGNDFIESNSIYKDVLNCFKDKTTFDLHTIMAEGPENTLKDTKFTQPAILMHSVMALQAFLAKMDIKPDYVAGHSLGEFSALVANGVLQLADAMYLVHKRGEFMIKANEGKPFAMAAVLGLECEMIKDICESVSNQHIVVAANYNTKNQTVISGTAEGVEQASQIAKEKNAKRVVPLTVGGPFHSPLIQKAAVWLSEEMKHISFKDTTIPVVCNVNAQAETKADNIIHNLTEQVTSSVLWVDSIEYLQKNGVNLFIEFGPQKVLTGMITKIINGAMCFNVDKMTDIDLVIKKLEEI